ncbi:hypothetical protein DNTS_008057 [Danionella cerebrum]|uniref:Insulin-like 3 n=1 Tax=Danionella cerebrum TaxID=2873325 RepID=A0A553NLH6_9TELE|nr:hypothetical protein DNTS_008057 [Danionella translucida]
MMHMKWFSFVAVVLLLEAPRAESADTRVKLCGREFIRMVVTSCGSSRLRRDVPQADLQFQPHWTLQNWLDRNGLVYQRGPLAVEGEHWPEQDAPKSLSMEPQLSEYSTTPQDLSTSSRTRRDVGPAGICCTSGCTMSELIQYC